MLITAIPCLVIACLPKQYRYHNKIYFFLTNFFYNGVLRALLLPIHIHGKELIPNEPAMFIANHQSALDIPLVGAIVGRRPHIWLVLSYYTQFPVLGFLICRMNIPVEQDKSMKAARALISVLRVARDSAQDLIIFPEGSRYSDGKVHDFFDGYALIIEKTKRPLVPIFIKNNYKIFPRGARLAQPYPIEAIVGPTFRIQPDETYQTLNERVRSWFLSQQDLA
ncbi:MAG: lysophospholipid acyltransferase family protein [Rickettsia endosymbiont of Ixodes persulcatus]|nr:lysophospholipid acyltransferase family protein [Rickettsia endosymbiont of Ixodes persulcatus]